MNTLRFLISEDYKRLGRKGKIRFIIDVFVDPSFSICFWQRLCNWAKTRKHTCLIKIFKLIYFFISRSTGIQVPIGTSMGGGLRFFHYTGIVISSFAVIGKNCSIFNGVTIGQSHSRKNKGAPTIEDGCVIFPGAKIIGKIKVGEKSIIGANAVVTKDCPPFSIVVGVNKVLPYSSLTYFDTDEDKKLYGFN